MPNEYLDDTPFLYADGDGEFCVSFDPHDSGQWIKRTCEELHCNRWAAVCEGAEIVPVAENDWSYINLDLSGEDQPAFWCGEHMPLVTAKEVNDEVTAALLEHKIDPHVVADISSRLDARLKSHRPTKVKEQA